ncbi:MDR family MFS transporter [Luteimicrobium xylanilyticum]|uniref:Putative transporter YebQ n=1 Tax=Luteimicrobium xylanilyticum TaxID=1133546 RepID=A0A5P9QDK3_9MICO|nr:MDR family MFS transporter [Luteimicrobium xylanilyticum]QFU99553.1 putative transporter YebQ [Luteimicrobium xylanilyticum]
MTTTTETAVSGASPADTARPGEKPAMTRRETLEAMSGILLGMFVALLATSVVSSSLPRIVSELNGSGSSYTWVVTATLLTTTITTPIWGKLADMTNRKLLIQLALVVAVLSSAAAGLSQNVGELILFRAFQGVGAGGLTALGTVLIADIVSPRERGKYMGLMGGVMAVSMVGGPILGGTLTDSIGWRWDFFVGLPIAIVAIAVLQKTLHLPKRTKGDSRIDYWGAALISVGVALLLLWVTFAGSNFDWVSWQTFAMVGGAVVALVAAILVEKHEGTDAIIPLHLFKNSTFVLAVVASIAVGVAMFGASVFLSQYIQIAKGKTPTQSGLLTIPMVVGVFLASLVIGNLIARTGRYKWFMVTGGVLLTVGLLLMGTIDYRTSFVTLSVYLFVIGVGTGMLMQNLVLAVQNTLDVHEIGSGTASVAFFRTLGGAIGVSVLGAVLNTRVTSSIADGLTKLGITMPGGSGGTLPEIDKLPAPVATVVEKAYGDGVAEIFLIAAPLALVAAIACVFLKEIPLGTKSGVELLQEGADAAGERSATEAEHRAELDTAMSVVAPTSSEEPDERRVSATRA